MYHNKHHSRKKKIAQLFKDHWHNLTATARRHGAIKRPYRIRQVCQGRWRGPMPLTKLSMTVLGFEDYKSVFETEEADELFYGDAMKA